jgi:hypothetical protein
MTRPLLIVLAACALAAVPLGATGASARYLPMFTGTLFDTTLDLGFDVSGVEHNPSAARSFLQTLDASVQRRLLLDCGEYVHHPEEARSPETRAFCINLYG